MINVTKTFLPPLGEYLNQLNRIWENEWLTNRGELVLELESKLKTFLETPNIIIMNNGTIPLQIALKILGNGGEVITTPFSYVATSSAIIWENCSPVFVDIHPEYLTIDESKIEDAITPNTTAILATHVFGNPCNMEVMHDIAQRHGIKIIYDAAHSFGVKYKNKSIFEYGDVSTCSFHATKIFHTGEGGAIFCNDSELNHKLYYSHNFGHNGPTKFHGLGINGKISELQAAMGLSVLPHIEHIFNERKRAVTYYTKNLNFKKIRTFKLRHGTDWNYSYYPVIFSSEKELELIQKALNIEKIFPRRYFYPSLNTIDYINGSRMPISESIASRILCLPLYCGMPDTLLDKICLIVNT
jgi:dTDP-4-amino-4,6-dideoxygalactose transaminase